MIMREEKTLIFHQIFPPIGMIMGEMWKTKIKEVKETFISFLSIFHKKNTSKT